MKTESRTNPNCPDIGGHLVMDKFVAEPHDKNIKELTSEWPEVSDNDESEETVHE